MRVAAHPKPPLGRKLAPRRRSCSALLRIIAPPPSPMTKHPAHGPRAAGAPGASFRRTMAFACAEPPSRPVLADLATSAMIMCPQFTVLNPAHSQADRMGEVVQAVTHSQVRAFQPDLIDRGRRSC